MAPYDSDPPRVPDGGDPNNGPEGKGARSGKGSRCPICGKQTQPVTKPFCSKRCADVDLHRWLAGVYAVPTNEGPEDEADVEAPKSKE